MVSFLGSVILLALAFGFSKSGLAKNFTELTQKLHASGTINCPKKKLQGRVNIYYSLNISKNNIFYSFSHIFFFVYDYEHLGRIVLEY